MDKYRPYRGRGSTPRRHRSSGAGTGADKSARRAIKLIICVALFGIAAFMKLVFPSTLQSVGDKLNSVVNYKAALATLGEGISGEKKFTAALGEAITYAFTGTPPDAGGDAVQTSGAGTTDAPSAGPDSAGSGNAASDSSAVGDQAAASPSDGASVETFAQDTPPTASPGKADSGSGDSDAAATSDDEKTFADAVIAAFQQDQEQYSDYSIPAGVSYAMPRIGISYVTPVKGVVSSSFGYRTDPADKTVKFHYGTDIDAKSGTSIAAFADGKVLAAGESATLGNYVLLGHGSVETEYAHCDKLYVEKGQAVKKGTKIATVGNTGNATGTYLHFELHVSGVYVNPEFYIQWT
ncbi:Peptidase family M23 [Sporobacter termitidis DSM 10068]|uniref:Peptidase family M23 n=1 Tax=Sporobacter termitidis DSM 10068 TaxID=1123282 RepID=A0A1M5TPE3_9FIRM|nr:peptidoglycan DD-metalloendopeptidase family protein [Sporobacter termitidis]SHH52637.1 Peptidase family M23 [Sporobacter termitidis DSM 10068]